MIGTSTSPIALAERLNVPTRIHVVREKSLSADQKGPAAHQRLRVLSLLRLRTVLCQIKCLRGSIRGPTRPATPGPVPRAFRVPWRVRHRHRQKIIRRQVWTSSTTGFWTSWRRQCGMARTKKEPVHEMGWRWEKGKLIPPSGFIVEGSGGCLNRQEHFYFWSGSGELLAYILAIAYTCTGIAILIYQPVICSSFYVYFIQKCKGKFAGRK